MKISYNWLKDYLDIDLSAEEVSELLTDIGLEVEDMSEYKGPGNGMEGLVVGKVKRIEPHPDADKLKITFVDAGNGNDLQIVCGAPNVQENQKVIVALVGTTLYPEGGEPFTIRNAKIRGVESSGMICAEDEIGLGKDHEGIIVLPEEVHTGTQAKDFYGIKEDIIFEIGLTPNRADATGHLGVARDLRAALAVRKNDLNLNLPKIDESVFANTEAPIEVVIENVDACPRYTGILIRNIQIAASPMWLKEKLKSVGLRPINNIVDITNFVLQEYGQPLHAFDASAIAGNKVIIKNLPDKTAFVTLDEVERTLDKDDLMICNEIEGMCIAGVFGGLHSGVTDSTTDIFLESAYFEPVSIRKTATRHNLRTDAAIRFEKGTDPNITVTALQRAVNMILNLAGGEVASEIIDVYPEPVKNFEVTIHYKNVDRLIGHSIDKELIRSILTKLEIEILHEDQETVHLSIPPFKVDVHREVDVIEEILRIYGFNNIPLPEAVRSSLSFRGESDRKEMLNNVISDYLAANGFHETVSNSIIQSKYFEKALSKEKAHLVKLLKSSNAELDVLRPNMLFSSLEAAAHNLNRRNANIRFFEFGKTYVQNQRQEFDEQFNLALLISGQKYRESWLTPDKQVDFFYLKSFIDNILARLGFYEIKDSEAMSEVFSYGLNYDINNEKVVEFGELDRKITHAFDIKQEVFFADFNWDVILKKVEKNKISFKEIPRFPGIRRDLALLINKSISFREIEKIAVSEGKRILKTVNLFDVYEDKKLGEGLRSYAISYYFEDEHKTLTDKEVEKVMSHLITRYKNELNAEIR